MCIGLRLVLFTTSYMYSFPKAPPDSSSWASQSSGWSREGQLGSIRKEKEIFSATAITYMANIASTSNPNNDISNNYY